MTESIWTLYRVRWDFLTQLCGQTPDKPDMIRKWLETREPKVKPPGGKSIEQINEEVLESITRGEGEPDTEFNKLVFAHDKDGNLAMRYSTVKAHIKDCARVISNQYVSRQQGERAFSTRVINGLYIDESVYWIPILDQDTGKPKRIADGEREKPVHARGTRGEPINALKCFEYALNARMEFTVKVLGESVAEKDLSILFQYGGVHGYAGERSDGEGRYSYEVECMSKKKGKEKANAA